MRALGEGTAITYSSALTLKNWWRQHEPSFGQHRNSLTVSAETETWRGLAYRKRNQAETKLFTSFGAETEIRSTSSSIAGVLRPWTAAWQCYFRPKPFHITVAELREMKSAVWLPGVRRDCQAFVVGLGSCRPASVQSHPCTSSSWTPSTYPLMAH